jgi:hypothetical protein
MNEFNSAYVSKSQLVAVFDAFINIVIVNATGSEIVDQVREITKK